jgi:hypothetical protein
MPNLGCACRLSHMRSSLARWIRESDGTVASDELGHNWAQVLEAYAAADAKVRMRKQTAFTGRWD